MEFYSSVLLAATVVTGSAWLALAAGKWLDPRAGPLVLPLAGLGCVLAAVSIGGHVAWGHTPGSDMAMSLVAFLSNHPAPFFSLVFSLAAYALGRRQVRPDDAPRGPRS